MEIPTTDARLRSSASRGTPAPLALAAEIEEYHGLKCPGTVPDIRERLHAPTVERRIENPIVAAICEATR
jgi:hypothetical protein